MNIAEFYNSKIERKKIAMQQFFKYKIFIPLIFLIFLIFFVVAGTVVGYSAQTNKFRNSKIVFDKKLYLEIKKQKETETYKPKKIKLPELDLSYIKEQKKEIAKQLNKPQLADDIENSLIHFNLPYQSKLSISGRKVIGFNYGFVNYKSPDKKNHISSPSDITAGVDMRQQMQVRVSGKVGNKIDVNVNYNDKDKSDQRDISVVYKGYKKDDLVSDTKYFEESGYVSKSNFEDKKLGLDVENVWSDLIDNGYIDGTGKISDKFYALPNAFMMRLNPKNNYKKVKIYEILEKSNYVEVHKPVLAKRDDVIQEVAFGDIQLEIPQTEFIGYRKTLFGLRLKAKYDKFNLTAIGSQTKGIVEKKEFRGNTTKEHRKIEDRAYLRRKYYKLYFSDTQKAKYFPIKKGTEEIYLFDQSSNPVGENIFEKSAESYGGSTAVKYKFKKLQPGRDYEIDYVDGVIFLKVNIYQNYAIAVDYEATSGQKLSLDASSGNTGKVKLLKDVNNLIKYNEIREYYSLGNTNILRGDLGKDFTYRVIDTNDVIVSNDYNDIEVDYVNGVLKFKKEKPFEKLYDFGKSIYDDENTVAKYRIEVEYSYEKADNYTYMIGKTIISGSENVALDGKKLERDKEYIIDYDVGIVTLINSDFLSSTSVLEITYEYIPFGGQFQQTLLGARAEYNFYDNSYLGFSTIYNGASKPTTAPSAYSSPKSITVVDSDFNLMLKKDNTILPFDMSLKGEVAHSIQNPNVFGAALVENMEGTDISDVPNLDYESWQIASNPNGKSLVDINKYQLVNEDIDLRTINPKLNLDYEKKVQTLGMNYKNLSVDEEASIVYVLGKEGVDYSQKKFLEVWIYSDLDSMVNSPSIYFRYGGIDEDADYKAGFAKDTGVWRAGDPKTEDLNGDGKLSIGEDVGWEYYPNGATAPIKIGANNGKLDSEDLNGNGIIDSDDMKGATYNSLIDEDGVTHNSVNWLGWKKFVIPINITTNGGVDNWKAIKNLRITVHNKQSSSSISGGLKFYNISAVGNKWQNLTVEPKAGADDFFLKSVSKETDSDYTSIADDSLTKSEYEKLYKNVDTKNITEQSIALIYTNLKPNATGYVTYNLTNDKKYDFSKYRNLKFFLTGDANNEEFFINFGSDINNYFEYTKILDWSKRWEIPTINLQDNKNFKGENISDGIPDGFTSYKGTPRLDNIKYIRIGIRNKTTGVISGKVFVDDIYLDGVLQKEGSAYKAEVGFSLPKNISLSGNVKHIDSDFETITTGSQNELSGSNSITAGQEIDSYGGSMAINTLKFMPTNFGVTKNITKTPKSYSTAFSIKDEGKVESESKNVATAINIKYLPKIGLSYNNANANFYDLNSNSVNLYTLTEKQNQDVYYGKAEYVMPLRGRFFEQRIYGDYRYEKIKHDYYDVTASTTIPAIEELRESYSFGTDLMLLNRLFVKPKYNYSNITNLKNNAEEDKRFFKKREERASIGSELVLLNWLRPNAEYNIVKTENFNVLDYSTFTTKDVSMENSGSVNLDIAIRSIFPKFTPTKSMNLNARYEVKDINSWSKVNKDYTFMDKWATRFYDGLVEEKYYFEDPKEGKQTAFSQEDTKTASVKYNPFEFIKTKAKWFIPINSISTRFSYRKTFIDTMLNDSTSETWPEILTDIKNIENMFFLGRFISNGELTTRYVDKEDFSFQIYDRLTNGMDTKYRFKFLKTFDCALNYQTDKYTEYNLDKQIADKNRKIRDVLTNQYGVQIGFNYKSWRFTSRYDNSDRNEFLINTTPKWAKNQALSIKADVDFNSTKGLKIPFKKKRIKVDNRIRIGSELKGRQQRGDILEDNKDIYDLILSSEYNFNSNFQVRLGTKVTDVHYLLKEDSNYMGALITTEVSIVF